MSSSVCGSAIGCCCATGIAVGVTTGVGAGSGILAAKALGISETTGAVFGAAQGCSQGCAHAISKEVFGVREDSYCLRRLVATAGAFFGAAGVGYGICYKVGISMDFVPTALKLAGVTLGIKTALLLGTAITCYAIYQCCSSSTKSDLAIPLNSQESEEVEEV